MRARSCGGTRPTRVPQVLTDRFPIAFVGLDGAPAGGWKLDASNHRHLPTPGRQEETARTPGVLGAGTTGPRKCGHVVVLARHGPNAGLTPGSFGQCGPAVPLPGLREVDGHIGQGAADLLPVEVDEVAGCDINGHGLLGRLGCRGLGGLTCGAHQPTWTFTT